MATIEANGVRLSHVADGAGPPLVLVHGSWGSRAEWAPMVPALAARLGVVAYDRRGHGASTCPLGQGSVRQDADDLLALIEALDLAPAWVAGNSFGGSIALRAAAAGPELVRGVTVHEPPLFGLLAEEPEFAPALAETGARIGAVARLIEAGDHAAAAERFVDTVAFGPGSWDRLPEEARALMAAAAPTFLDETRDPEQLLLDEAALARFPGPVLLTQGSDSPPAFRAVIRRLAGTIPRSRIHTVQGAGHIPHVTHPEPYAAALLAFVESAA